MAQQYPSAPPFGAPYGPAPTYYPPYQQHGVQQPSHTPPVFQQQGQHPPGGFQTSPGVNTSRFEANSQIRPLGQSLPFPAAPFTSDMFKQFAQSNIPPPPPPGFPPVPFPQVGFSHPQLIPATPSAYPQQHPIPGPTLSDSTAYDPRFPQGVPPQPRLDNPFLPNPNSEGSEVGPAEGGVNGAFPPRPVSSNGPLSQQPAPSFQTQNYNFNPSVFVPPPFAPSQSAPFLPAHSNGEPQQSAHSATGNMLQSQSVNSTTMLNRPASGAPYKPPSPSLLQAHIPSPGFDTQKQPRRGKSKALETLYEKKTIPELRQLAKSALLSLVPHNIQFTDLLKEGVDRTVLQQLFVELGIKPDTESSNGQPQLVAEDNASLASVAADSVTSTSAINLSSIPAPSIPNPPLTISAGLERKDRIAQLLAAKAGRPSPVRAMGDAVTLTNAPKSLQSPTTIVPASSSATRAVSQETPGIEMQAEVQPRNMTRAALVRQKTEELRKEATAKATGENRHPGTVGPLDLGQLQNSQLSNISLSDLSTPAREELMQNGFASMIPGLFMTSAEVARREQVLSLNNDSLAVDDMGSPKSLASLRKRPFPSAEDDKDEGRIAKRPNFSAQNNDEEMNDATPSGEGEGDDDISEGEVVETDGDSRGRGTSASDMHSTEHRALEQNSRVRGLASNNAYQSRVEEVGAPRNPTGTNEQHPQSKSSYTQLDSPGSFDTSTTNLKHAPDGVFNVSTGSTVGTPVGDESSTNPPKALSTRPLTRLTPAQIAEKAASLKAEFLRQRAQRAQRQKALQEGLPDLNEEVRKTESRLAEQRLSLLEIKQQIKKLDLELLQARSNQEETLKDISRLENLLQQGISGQKQYSDELRRLKTEGINVPPAPSIKSNPLSMDAARMDSAEMSVTSTLRPTQDIRDLDQTGVNKKSSAGDPETVGLSSEARISKLYDNDFHPAMEKYEESASQGHDSSAGEVVTEMISHSSQQESLKGSSPDTDGMMGDHEDNSDGSASMSDSGSDFEDDYEPAAADSTHSMDMDDAESDEYDPEEVAMEGSASENQVQEEAYHDDLAENLEPGRTQGVSFVQNAPSTTGNSDSRIALQEAPGQQLSQSLFVAPPTTPVVAQIVQSEYSAHLSTGNAITRPQNTAENSMTFQTLSGNADNSTTDFKPYESPLNAFKAFRYNPQFDTAAKDGFRSLTYSNNIDPAIPLCPTELSGHDCTDSACEEQHFRHLGLSDDKILVQLSSANDITDKTMRDRYLLGLRQVIADLRQKGVKEFENVADALSAYRRQFYADQDAV